MDHPRSLLRRAAGAAAALVVASAALLSAGSSPARVDQNTDIKFGPITLAYVTDKGEAVPAPNRQLYKGDWFYLNVDFDVTKANPKPSQPFTIDLPEPFVSRDSGNSRGDVIKPLEYTDPKGATVKAGECKVDKSRITCTSGNAIGGKLDVVGKIQAQLLALGTTDKISSALAINGKKYTAAHPWSEGIILRPAVQFRPDTRLTKGIKGVGTNSTWINWHVLSGGSWSKANYSNGGPVTATDVIQDGLGVPNPATVKPMEVQVGPDGTGETGCVAATADEEVKRDGYDIQASFEDRTVTFKVTGPLFTDKNYRIDFDIRFTGGSRTAPGHEYRNQARLVETNKDINVFTRSYFKLFSVTISCRQDFDGFQVTKASAGSAVPSARQKFDVAVAYKLPNGKTIANFLGWDVLTDPARMAVTVGQTTPSVTFPTGTEITLTEDVATASPAVSGIVWGDPKSPSGDNRVTIGGDSRTATFTVVDRATLPILSTNNATRITGGPPTPPAPDPGNLDPTDSADPRESDSVDPPGSVKAPKTVPTPTRPGLPRTGHGG